MERAVALETTGEVTLRVLPDRIAGYSGSSTTARERGSGGVSRPRASILRKRSPKRSGSICRRRWSGRRGCGRKRRIC